MNRDAKMLAAWYLKRAGVYTTGELTEAAERILADQPAATETHGHSFPGGGADCTRCGCLWMHRYGLPCTTVTACSHLIRDGQTTIGACELEQGHGGEHMRGGKGST